jgi:uncharacterized protein YfaS (alpha-2-macroglobulin family)
MPCWRRTTWPPARASNSLFLAGRSLVKKPEQDWNAVLEVAGQLRELSNSQPAVLLQGAGLGEPLSLSNPGEQSLYQQLTLSGYPAQAPRAGGNNLSIEREYYDLGGNALDLNNLQSGQLVLVHLAVRADERVPDALLVDLLPAGLELENQNLAQSAASLDDASSAVKDWQKSMQNAAIKHQEFRDDRYVAALDVNGYDATHLLYLARAVTPGIYRVPPPQVESMYRPAWKAQGEAPEKLVVRGR